MGIMIIPDICHRHHRKKQAADPTEASTNLPDDKVRIIFRVVKIVIVITVIDVINDDGDTGMMLSKLIALQQHHLIVSDNVLRQTRCYQLS